MKKVININFQGRVIPIEESAYDILKQYVESLRNFFANEEGRDEIINDIEGRIAELFGETLKKGATCIVDDDVNNIIASMGRPEDFEAEEEHVKSQLGGEKKQAGQGQQQSSSSSSQQQQNANYGDGKLYRDENHKILGGVCSGLARYFNTDPVVIRVLAVIFSGVFFIPYMVLWVAVPGTSSVIIGSQRKRLYRDPEDKYIGGVCSGLAQYFGVNVWVPRLLFLVPFLSFVFRWNDWGFWDFPHFLRLSFSPGSLFIYIILWLVLPEARTSAERLEMKGEKVDLNTIKNTIQGDLEGFPKRAQEYGKELHEKGQQWSKEYGAEATQNARRATRGIGDAIALIAKIFAYFILGIVLLSVVATLFGLGIAFTGLLPVKSYLINDGWETVFAWGTLILFIWVPVIGIITMIIRRLGKMRGNRNLIRYSFLSLWLVGVFCFVSLICSLGDDFRYTNYPTEQVVPLANPGVPKLEVKMGNRKDHYHYSWFRMEPFSDFDEDTVFVPNMRLKIVKSDNDSFRVTMMKFANAETKTRAEQLASSISFSAIQTDSILNFDRGVAITKKDKFRNQFVEITIAVPVGKRILINDRTYWNHVHVDFGPNRGWHNWDIYDDEDELDWRRGVEYIMNTNGKLERVDKKHDDDDNDNIDEDTDHNEKLQQYQKSREVLQKELEQKQKEAEEIKKELDKPLIDTMKKK